MPSTKTINVILAHKKTRARPNHLSRESHVVQRETGLNTPLD